MSYTTLTLEQATALHDSPTQDYGIFRRGKPLFEKDQPDRQFPPHLKDVADRFAYYKGAEIKRLLEGRDDWKELIGDAETGFLSGEMHPNHNIARGNEDQFYYLDKNKLANRMARLHTDAIDRERENRQRAERTQEINSLKADADTILKFSQDTGKNILFSFDARVHQDISGEKLQEHLIAHMVNDLEISRERVNILLSTRTGDIKFAPSPALQAEPDGSRIGRIEVAFSSDALKTLAGQHPDQRSWTSAPSGRNTGVRAGK